ncbi:uncharacterized protein Z519_07148 [Cladophialophora bantiana CBS 173.52]|uniref:Uncharacterized protein n=1 Tax=Cladophialophora bantiana (strain ATCC 10958 / CBS 173.52 / CDC B-1940 / NIH 8579) TaxID=1442370 RepID=A0A0D2I5I3_CLAB1|nr:uncharacterized protein Z519_07148 [Cladophialophora bantiana CBS 173.52]KIW92164.1 hypothetical protein Z519_07148 [Cladophialophora bantiana CBS 173.52]
MYPSLVLPWSNSPSDREATYRSAGLVKTKGTLFLLPPSTSTLRDTFNAPPRPKTRMSSGAVALCKHFERGGASSEHGRLHPFWTMPTGSNENKSEIARGILEDMLVQAVWRNVMLLHDGVAVYEIRNASGYGMRWTLDIEEKKENHQVANGVSGDLQATPVGPDPPDQGENEDDFHKEWIITRTTFRGFLEPIAGMDHELPDQGVGTAELSQCDGRSGNGIIADGPWDTGSTRL